MKKKIMLTLLAAVLAAMTIILTGCAGTEMPANTPALNEPTASPEMTADPLADYSVVGPWGLSSVKNDMAALYTLFGSSLRDYGASIELKSSGEVQYYVGATGGAGTYSRDGRILTANVTDYNEGNQSTLELKLEESDNGVYLTTVINDTLLWWTQNETELGSANAAADTAAYDALLETYRTALREKYDDVQLSDAGLNYMLNFYREKDGLAEIGYCLKDIDGDGSPELFVAPVGGDEFYANIIFDMYTLVNGESVHVISAGERYRYYLLADGTIYYEGSNGAAETIYSQHTIINGDISDMVILSFNAAADAGAEWSVYYAGGEWQAVSASDADALINGWQAQISKPEYTPLGA